MLFDKLVIPSEGQPITVHQGVLRVPDNPIISTSREMASVQISPAPVCACGMQQYKWHIAAT